MSVWWIRGGTAERFDGLRHFGRPPVLAPPAWALAEQVWRGIGANPIDSPESPAEVASGVAFESAPEATPVSLDPLCADLPPSLRRLALVVPDGTRVGPWRELLPELLPRLRQAAPKVERTLLVASGMHAGLTPEALRRHLLPAPADARSLLEGWALMQNGDNGFRDHVPVGSTPAGTPVALHPAYVEADYRILLGEISWHYFAGFGGGRKLVYPGLGAPEGVSANHRRAVVIPEAALSAPQETGFEGFAWRPECGPGLLHGNPVHEDLEAAVALQPPHWVLTAVDDPPADPDPAVPSRFPHTVVQGPYPAAFAEATRRYESKHRVPLTVAPQAMIADAGGSPRDATFLQAHKSLQHALRFLAPRGRLLLVAQCGEGLGSSTLARFAADPARFRPMAGVAADPMAVLHIQTLTALRRAVEAAEIGLWSDLPETAVRALGMRPCTSREDALDWIRGEGAPSWGWLPRAERFLPEEGWRGGALR